MSEIAEIIGFFELIQEKRIIIGDKGKNTKEKTAIIEWDYDKSVFDFYNVMNFVRSIVDEIEIYIEDNQMIISTFDPSRIILLKMVIPNVKSNGDFSISLNSDDLTELLHTKITDKRRLKLIFKKNHKDSSEDGVEIQKIKGKSVIKKHLRRLDLDLEQIELKHLSEIEYFTNFHLSKFLLDEILYNAEPYSEILSIKDKRFENITFYSDGQIGDYKFIVPFDDLPFVDAEGGNDASYSLTFINNLKKLFPIYQKDDIISFFLKTDHPLLMEFEIEDLGINFKYFLAPRCEEADDDDDMDEFKKKKE